MVSGRWEPAVVAEMEEGDWVGRGRPFLLRTSRPRSAGLWNVLRYSGSFMYSSSPFGWLLGVLW